MRRCLCLVLAVGMLAASAQAERVKDIVIIQGVRSNPIWGYGLVIGLQGTGDDAAVSRRALASVLRRSGLVMDPEDVSSKNIASVLVTAELPAFGRVGSTIDVTVSSIGDAASLQGGMLLMTPLRGADGEVYAVSQGSLTIGGFASSGESASVTQNHPTVGRIPNGAIIEQEELADIVEHGAITLALLYSDFTTADTIARAINTIYPNSAIAKDAGAVVVQLPPTLTPKDLAGFIDKIGALEVEVDQRAVVVINERTGTIIFGENVGISTAAISHGNLSVVTTERPVVSQPRPFAPRGASTERLPRTSIDAVEEVRAIAVVKKKISVSQLARALNAMGFSPRDLITVLEALREAGALQAELKVM